MDHTSGGWGIVRVDWVNHPEVGPDELALLALLSLYANQDGACWPSQSTLADRLKRSRSWVIRVLNRLEDLGMVARSQQQAARGRRSTCLYTLVGHADAIKGTSSAHRGNHRGAAHRVAGAEQEHRNPANAGLSSEARAGEESQSETEAPGRGRRSSTKTVPPEDWVPSPADRAFAAEHASDVDVDQFGRFFVQSCRSHNYRYADHGAAFRSWLLNRWKKPDATSGNNRDHPPLSRSSDNFRRDHRQAAQRQCPDARTAANRDSALAALTLLAVGHT
jgi:Helix-turn-helix domain